MGKFRAVALRTSLLLLGGCQRGQPGATDMAIRDLAVMDSAVRASADGAAASADLATYTGPVFAVGMRPVWLATGDFNGDGNLDVATANQSSGDVSILLGDGRGAFAMANNIVVAPMPAALLTADFNGDGIVDLVVMGPGGPAGTSSPPFLSIILGSPAGAFAVKRITADYNNNYLGMTSGDWNKDGKVDLAVTGASGIDTLLFGDGTGAFVSSPGCVWDQHSDWLASADLNGDGAPELVMNGYGEMHICANDGTGKFSRSTKIPYAPMAVDSVSAITADVNGDQMSDLIIADSANAATVLLNDGMGGLGTPTVLPVGGPLAVGDFNKDGRLDVAGIDTRAIPSISVLLGDGTGSFGAPSALASSLYPVALAAGDFNRDGKDDLVAASRENNTVTIFLNPFH